MAADTDELVDDQEQSSETIDQPNLEAEPGSEDEVLGRGPRRVDAGAAQAAEHEQPAPAPKRSQEAAGNKTDKSAKPKSAAAEVSRLAQLAKRLRALATAIRTFLYALNPATLWVVFWVAVGIVAIIVILVAWPYLQGLLGALQRGLLGGGGPQPVTHQQDDTRVRDLLASTGNVNAIREAITSSAKTTKQKLAELKQKIQPDGQFCEKSNPKTAPALISNSAD